MKRPEILTASDQIEDDLKNAILRGELKLGEKLPTEAELAEVYGVSRPTVRTALKSLEEKEILRSRKGCQGGWFVRSRNKDQVAAYLGSYMTMLLNSNQLTSAQLWEIRSIVEVKGCGLAAVRRTPEDLQAIAAALPVEYKNLSDYQYHSKDIEFHRRVAEATQNPLLVITINATTMAQELYAMTIPAPDKIRQELNNNLLQIYKAIVEQNVVQAEKAMAEHLGYYKRMTGRVSFSKTE